MTKKNPNLNNPFAKENLFKDYLEADSDYLEFKSKTKSKLLLETRKTNLVTKLRPWFLRPLFFTPMVAWILIITGLALAFFASNNSTFVADNPTENDLVAEDSKLDSASLEIDSNDSIPLLSEESKSKERLAELSDTIESETSDYPNQTSEYGQKKPARDILEAGVLTAGEWNDVQNRQFWENLMQKPFPSDNKTYEDVVKAWGFDIFNTDRGQEQNQDFQDYLFDHRQYQYPRRNYNKVQIAFIVDTTGSMEDELSFLQTELASIINEVTKENPNLDIEIALIFYRDNGDEYVVRTFDFSSDLKEVIYNLNRQEASGGRDFPEAVEEAFQKTFSSSSINWDHEARTKLVFWVADAPFSKTKKDKHTFQASLSRAAGYSVNIFPIASSGIDKETEILMRATAIRTKGSYIFLTDHSGVGNSHLEPTVGDYQVEYLNQLLVRVINQRVR